MAIDRAPWNALVDDDGSNLVGSIWNKAAIKTVLLDPIDAMGAHVIGNTETGTIANWTPAGFGTRNAVIYWSGTGDLSIGALKSGIEGQVVTVKNRGTGIIRISHYATPAAGFTQFLNVATSAPTPIAPEGWVSYVNAGGFWVIAGHEQGAWISPAYNAADYSGWTVTAGQVRSAKYRLAGKTLHWNLDVFQGALAVAGSCVRVIMGGFTVAAGNFPIVMSVIDTSGAIAGYALQQNNVTTFYRTAAGAVIAAGAVSIYAQGHCEVT
jgi:hypothetical protein